MHPKTAQQDHLSAGIAASHALAKADLPKIESLAELFHTAVAKSGLPYVVLAGIDNQEFHCGVVLTRKGWSDNNDVFGIMQIDCLGPSSSFSSVYFLRLIILVCQENDS